MKGKLGEKLERLREAVEDVVGLGLREDVKRVLEATTQDRPMRMQGQAGVQEVNLAELATRSAC